MSPVSSAICPKAGAESINVLFSSSGLLIYAALVDLLYEDFLSEHAQHVMNKATKIKAFCYLLAGGEYSGEIHWPLHSSKCANAVRKAAGMSIVGAFA